MHRRILIAIVAGALACASGQPDSPPRPEDLAGTWAYRFTEMERMGGSIFISADTSAGSLNEVSFEGIGAVRRYRGVLRRLLDEGFFVCWTDETEQVAGLELTAHSGTLQVTYFDECRGNIQRSPAFAQRSVRHCRHSPLMLRRTAPAF